MTRQHVAEPPTQTTHVVASSFPHETHPTAHAYATPRYADKPRLIHRGALRPAISRSVRHAPDWSPRAHEQRNPTVHRTTAPASHSAPRLFNSTAAQDDPNTTSPTDSTLNRRTPTRPPWSSHQQLRAYRLHDSLSARHASSTTAPRLPLRALPHRHLDYATLRVALSRRLREVAAALVSPYTLPPDDAALRVLNVDTSRTDYRDEPTQAHTQALPTGP